MGRLKEARKEGRRANFNKSEPDKLYNDGKYVKLYFLLTLVLVSQSPHCIYCWYDLGLFNFALIFPFPSITMD